ncbi:tumor protein D54 isoform X4 [Elephas maximus indicus]|uniref:tumor protein D54 isoform X4 n=1 Tax=Elephas maximus indicus TaxID=99487 RepID=UPI0021168E7A|nr:tumor protein D54 isoform X4 [Elephas maximus indicus]
MGPERLGGALLIAHRCSPHHPRHSPQRDQTGRHSVCLQLCPDEQALVREDAVPWGCPKLGCRGGVQDLLAIRCDSYRHAVLALMGATRLKSGSQAGCWWPAAVLSGRLLWPLSLTGAHPFSHSFSNYSIRHSISMPAMRSSATFKSFEDHVGTIKSKVVGGRENGRDNLPSPTGCGDKPLPDHTPF